MSGTQYTISLRTMHPTKTSKWVERALRLKATHARSLATPHRIDPDERVLPLDRGSYCVFVLIPVRPGRLTDGVGRMVSMLSDRKDAFDAIRMAQGTVELFVGLIIEERRSAAFELDPALMSRLFGLGVRVSIEVRLRALE